MTENKFEREEKIVKFWQDNQIYEKVQKKNEDSEQYVHVDGPPYPTGEAHMGHLRNWTVKDSVLRFKRLEGLDVYARDGYDAHGLPVENKVQAKLNLKTVEDLKKFGEENFVKECKKYANEIIDEMRDLRIRYGLWMNRNEYKTFHPEYVSMAWQFFKKADEKNLLYKDYKTVAWCPHDQTTLSDYEIKDTYKELEDPSIYVKFPIRKEHATTKYKESILIWTTTPWTLQSNMAVAMHPKFEYSKILVKLNNKEEVLLVATSLIEKIIETLSKQNDIELIEILETKVGAEYEGVKYDHIYTQETPSQQEFLKEEENHKHLHSVVLADFVTLGEGEDIFEKLEKKGYKHSNKQKEDQDQEQEQEKEQENNKSKKPAKSEGTGIVHIAPGHGFDDYDVGKRYNLPIFCPVGPDGKFTEGKYEKQYFKDVDPIAIKYLKEKNFLVYNAPKKHRYPCCWRCKTPIVYRAADQWWIKRGEYTHNIIKENQNVKWFPQSAKTAFNNLMEGAGDWAISRQRYWGIPLPIFEDEDGNYEVFGSKEELEARIGKQLEDIHRDDLKNITLKNLETGKTMYPVPFIADVWFDSGCASFASHYGEGLNMQEIVDKYYPMNWITEGEDQIRGWFSSLFNVGYLVTGKVPYNQVLFQGFVMDETGKQKMSKSVGNGISGNEAIELYGADQTRYYLLTKALPESKLNFDQKELKNVESLFNTIENITKYMNSYLNEYELRHPSLEFIGLDIEDKWILYKLNRTIQTYKSHFNNFKINQAYKELEDFITKDLSKTYLKLIKDRTDTRDENLLTIFNEILKKVLIILSPAVPFLSEDLYQNINFTTKKESLFLESMPQVDQLIVKDAEKHKIHENFELAQEIVQATLNAREKASIGIRWPLGEINIISPSPLKEDLEMFEKLIKHLTNISKIKYDLEGVEINYNIKPNFATIKQDFQNIPEVLKAVNSNKTNISEDIKLGEVVGTYNDIKIDFEKHIIKELNIEGDFISSDFKQGSIILHTQQDEILLEEGYLRELVRKVQSLRKDLDLNKSDEIQLSFHGSEQYYLDLVSNWSNYISKKVGATDILEEELDNKNTYNIKEKKLVISIQK